MTGSGADMIESITSCQCRYTTAIEMQIINMRRLHSTILRRI